MRRETAGDVHQLTYFNERGLSVNCYLVEEQDGLTLIDTAITGCAEPILRAAADIGKPIARIALTHAHHDHAGSLDELKQALPDATVHWSRREARIMAGDRSLEPGETDAPIRGAFTDRMQTKPDTLLGHGDRVGSLLVLAAPGHTPGSIAFLDTRSGALIAGDAMQTAGEVRVAGHLCPSFPFPARGTWSPADAIASARTLLAHSPRLLAVGHGPLLRRPQAAMERAIAEAAAALLAE